jgi:hypothetical protein
VLFDRRGGDRHGIGRSGGGRTPRNGLGEAEIEHLGVAALGDEDIGGLDVAVDDSLGMGGVEAIGNFDGEREQGFVFERLAGDEVLEGHAIEELHGDEGLVAVAADFVNGADVGVI